MDANFAFKYHAGLILITFIHLFFCFHSCICSILTPFWYPKCWLRGHAVIQSDPIWSTCPKTDLRLGNECSTSKIFSGQYLGRYRCIAQVKRLYEVRISKCEICQSDCRFRILAKNYRKKLSFFFWYSIWNMV